LLLLLVAFSLGSLSVLLSGAGWWLAPLAIAAVVLAAAGGMRALRPARLLPFLAGAAMLVVSLTVTFAGDTALFSLVPLEGTLARAADLILEGRISIAEQAAPAEVTQGIVFIVTLATGVLALVADTLAFQFRAPALTAAPALALMAVPVVVRPGEFDAAFFVLAALAYLALLQVERRRREPLRALALGASALVLAFVLPGAIPSPSEADGPGISGAASIGINPVIDLGQDLRRPNASLAFTYTTSSTEAVYFKLTALTRFSGDRWEPLPVETQLDNTMLEFGDPPGLTNEVARTEVSTTVQIGDLAARWLPVPYPATSIEGLEGSWFWEPTGLSVRTNEANARGQLYTASSLAVRPTEEQLDAAQTDGVPRTLTALPEDLPEDIAAAALEVTQGAESDYDRAVALQSFFTGGEFRYSEEAPVTQDFDGTGMDAISRFLEVRSGYCVHFASAMAVMSRSLEIPARVVVGFQPGQPQFRDGEFSHFEVTTHDMHAWPELFFDDIGWVRFEPTPGRGDRPDYRAETTPDDPATPEVDESQPTAAPTSTPSRAPVDLPDENPTSGAATGGGGDFTGALTGGGIAVGAAALLLVPAALRLLRRRTRLREVRGGADPATAAWTETLDTARDLGIPIRSTETARVAGARIAVGLPPDARDAVGRLQRSVEAESYAPDRVAPSAEDVDAVRTALGRLRGVRDRVFAFLAPRSLLLMLPGSRD
jgi:transglutaminase-like putative cysteine protease